MAAGTALAIGGSALLGAGASLYGADKQEDAIKDAAAVEWLRLRQLKPYQKAGTRSLAQFEENIGQAPSFADITANIESDPGYQFQLEQGMNAIQGGAAARGNLLSGRTLKGLLEYGQGLGTQYANQAYSRELGAFQNKQNQLLALIQGGQSASGAQSSLPQLALQGGQVQADMATNLANVGSNALGNLYLSNLLRGAS